MEGLARVCCSEYSAPTRTTKHKTGTHLTNYSLSKYDHNFVHTDDPADGSIGTKRTMSSVLDHVGRTTDHSRTALWGSVTALCGGVARRMAETVINGGGKGLERREVLAAFEDKRHQIEPWKLQVTHSLQLLHRAHTPSPTLTHHPLTHPARPPTRPRVARPLARLRCSRASTCSGSTSSLTPMARPTCSRSTRSHPGGLIRSSPSRGRIRCPRRSRPRSAMLLSVTPNRTSETHWGRLRGSIASAWRTTGPTSTTHALSTSWPRSQRWPGRCGCFARAVLQRRRAARPSRRPSLSSAPSTNRSSERRSLAAVLSPLF